LFYFHFKVINEELGKRLLLLLLLLLPKLIIAGVCGFCSSSAGEIEHIFNVSRNVNERVPCSQLPDIDLRPWIESPHLHPSHHVPID